MMKSVSWLVPAILLAIAWQASATCPSDCPVGGKIKFRTVRHPHLTIHTDRSAANGVPVSGSAGDPVLHGATLRVFTQVGDQFDVTYQLPHDNWHYVRDVNANLGYRYQDLGQLQGPIGLVLARPVLGTEIHGAGDGLGLTLATNPNPVHVVLTYGGSTVVCGSYGGLVNFHPNVDYKGTRAPAPATCSPSGAFLE
jgi:hypothetical protein